MTSPWHAGAARSLFAIPAGTPLAGYAARNGPATGTLDDLQIAALALAHDGSELVIVTADLVGIDAELVDEVATAGGIDPGSLLLAASHTHSGPAGVVNRLHPATGEAVDADLRARFVASCGQAIRAATSRRRPATLSFGRSTAAGVGANRNSPDGPADDRVTTLSVQSTGDETLPPLATLVHFACHPTILGAENRLVSADLPGGMRRALSSPFPPLRQGEASPGGGDTGLKPSAERDEALPGLSTQALGDHSDATSPVILYGNGAAGDISTRFTRQGQTYAEVDRLGLLLAAGVSRAVASAVPLDGPLRRASLDVTLARKPDPGREAPAIARRLRAEADRVLAGDAPAAEKRRAFTRAQGAELAATIAGATGIPATARITVWSLGDLAVAAVPGELFASLGREIERGSPFETTLITGYANGHVGYLVDPDAEESGTYEALASPYTPDAGAAIVRGSISILRDLRG